MATNNLSELKKLKDALRKASSQQEINTFYGDCCKEMAARFLRKVIKKTPVGEGAFEVVDKDTKGSKYTRSQDENGAWRTTKAKKQDKLKLKKLANGGALRRGWTALSESEANKGSGGGDISKAVEGLTVSHSGGNHSITVTNCMKYASYVEYGHSQRPNRFVPVLGRRLKASWVKGHFMMTQTEKEMAMDHNKILVNKLKRYLTEKGGLGK